MRALIVDDEALARSKLLRMLQVFPDVEVTAEASDGAAALLLVAQLRPDAIFLDVQMPGIDGFDVAASLPDDAPALVFVTAFDQYDMAGAAMTGRQPVCRWSTFSFVSIRCAGCCRWCSGVMQ
ncbi:DNA-binding LytR/AlgR family response regulator [Paraburkholderia sp. GAS41]|jgi:DNA-binding LytR/AlgR family response regulator